MMSECSARAFAKTCKAVLYQQIILSINKINSMKILHNACFPLTEEHLHRHYTPKTARCWTKWQYIPPKKVLIYWPPQHRLNKTWISIHTPVRTWQTAVSLNCFNLHYETWTNSNIMAIEFHNLTLWEIYSYTCCVKFDKYNLQVNNALFLAT